MLVPFSENHGIFAKNGTLLGPFADFAKCHSFFYLFSSEIEFYSGSCHDADAWLGDIA